MFVSSKNPQASSAIPITPVCRQTFEPWFEQLSTVQQQWIKAVGFKPDEGRLLLLPDAGGHIERVFFGMGAKPEQKAHNRLLFGKLPLALPQGIYRFDPVPEDAFLAALAWGLGLYRFDELKSTNASESAALAELVVDELLDIAALERIVEGVFLTRDLINQPANLLGPEELFEHACALTRAYDGECTQIVGDVLLERGFPLIYAVGVSSPRLPRLIECRWGNPEHPKITLVGKGVVYDTGGLDLKPSSAMKLMKKDMGGAANVLGLALMIMDAGLPVYLRVLIPAVENAVSGDSFRTGDVYRSRKGLSVEIGNTDAEGRLVLADAISLADEEKPDLMVIMATLTGAARVALGADIPAFYTHDEALADRLQNMAEAVSDPMWRLPLYQPYMQTLDSKLADINHIGSMSFAGSITAALFLSRFIEKTTSWAHFDVYAWSPEARPGISQGGAAQCIRALFEMIKKNHPKSST